ncbi:MULTISPECIES: Ycf51 family protein [Chroococcidiopsis]|jgi:hypothetical protein|uniref:Protein of function (DUF2518) n=1 Tax=Chroococcidiopsis thermalis (strain PCC 7203) TaxID=251229 RepID=K9TW93_CHRTP|nr:MULTISPECIES: Ycf51 family protein [Chroococcidiopsis]AFY86820.1 Protein of unknown function DUF2518 [Chroococcidiopsis thermalis PCC 7203]PSB49310.1 hypothetical protein C7B80_02350 [Cyanosarcina cf. burmensis CCALA 770]URD51678.1 Ycf51 family protein [Chroococcidiopsis sp. CCNUC1]
MPTTTDFLNASGWVGITTLALAAITVLGFLLKWGIRFRLVGITGFLGVLTGGLFALGLVPFTRTVIPGAVRYSLVFDNGGTQTVIAVPPTIDSQALEATMQQAASDLFSYGRLGRQDDKLTIRVRTNLHPEPGVTKPLYLGQIERSLSSRTDNAMEIKLNPESIAQLPGSRGEEG